MTRNRDLTESQPGSEILSTGTTRSDSMWMAAAHGAGIATAIGVMLLATRTLSKEDVAILAWGTATAMFLIVLAGMGAPRSSIGLLSGKDASVQATQLARLATMVLASTGIVAVIWWFMVGPAFADASGTAEYTVAIAAVTVWIPAGVLIQLIEASARARGDFRLAAASGLWIRRAIMLAVLVAFGTHLIDASLGTLLMYAAVIELIAAAVLAIWLVRGLPWPAFPRPAAIIDVSRFSVVFLPTAIFAALIPQAGIWLSALVASPNDVADLALAVRASFLVNIPFFIGARVFTPRIAAARDLSRLEAPIRRFALIASVIAGIAALFYMFAGAWLLELVFGSQYRSAAHPLVILTAGQLVMSVTGLCGQCLLYQGFQGLVARMAVVGGMFFVPASLIFGALWGAAGAALAATIVMTIQSIVMLRFARSKLGINTLPVITMPSRRPVH